MHTSSRRLFQLRLSLGLLLASCGDDAGTEQTEDVARQDAADGDADAATDLAEVGPDIDAALDTGSAVGVDGSGSDATLVDTLVDVETEETGPGATDWPTIARTPAGVVDEDAWDPAGEAPVGSARGGRVRAGTHPFLGPEARCRPGDLVLANEHLRACIASSSMTQVLYAGGNLVDILPAGVSGPDTFELLVPTTGLRVGGGDEVALIADGRDGGPAVVRQRGVDHLIKLLGNFVGNFTVDPQLWFETEYRLAPGATRLEIVTWVRADRAITVQALDLGDMVMPGDGSVTWTPGAGRFATLPDRAAQLYVASAPSLSVGVAGARMTLTAFAPGLLDAQVNPIRHAVGRITAETEAAYVRYVAVGADTVAVRAALADIVPPRSGHEVELTGPIAPPFDDRRYEIRSETGESLEIVRLSGDGAAMVTLPAGTYTATPIGPPPGAPADTTFTVDGPMTVALQTPPIGTIAVSISATDADTPYASPARVRVLGASMHEFFAIRGALDAHVPPGTYQVEVSRGDEFSVVVVDGVEVLPGETTPVGALLNRIWDTRGLVSGDFHQHQLRSVDSSVFNDDRIASNLGAGVDFFAPSDHDVVENWAPLIEEMGVADLLHVITGIEISPTWGHMNAFPMPFREDLPAGGGVPLSLRANGSRAIEVLDAPSLVAHARALGATLVQLNHPRDSAGILDSAEFDPIAGPELVDPEYWPGTFESIEVINTMSQTCAVMHDWFSLLSRGIRVAGVGNSDTHSLSSPAGYPRNFLGSPTDDPAALTDDDIVTAVRNLDVSVSAGLLIDFPEGHHPGDTLAVEPGDVSLGVRVQSTAWSSPTTLVVFVDGVEHRRIDISGTPEPEVVDFLDTVTFPVERDAYVLFVAYGGGMSRVTPGERAVGFTNPVFLDVGGDGWTPPGVRDAPSFPRPVLPFCE